MIVGMKIPALFLGAALLSMPFVADAAGQCLPRFEAGWIRLPASAAVPMTGGFGRFVNDCDAPVEVVSATSPGFAEVSLHETTQVDGVNRMREVSAMALPAGGDVELRPGGLHLMLMQPVQPLRAGARLPLVFGLRDGRQIHAALEVRQKP